MSEDHITLDHPDRERILAEIHGDFKKLNRLHSVAQQTESHGLKFASKKEAGRYSELKLAERAGIIMHLRTQVLFPLIVNDVPIFPSGYKSDFVYIARQKDGVSWKLTVEDSKGFRTEIYQCKRQLMKAVWGITILET